jgi:hypothetical protein
VTSTLALLMRHLRTGKDLANGRNPSAKGFAAIRAKSVERGRTNRCADDGKPLSGSKIDLTRQSLEPSMYTGLIVIMVGGFALSFSQARTVKESGRTITRRVFQTGSADLAQPAKV